MPPAVVPDVRRQMRRHSIAHRPDCVTSGSLAAGTLFCYLELLTKGGRMTFWELFAVAVALSMDAFAVAVGAGCALPRVTAGHYLRLAGAFGFFQFAMPLAGWAAGIGVRSWIEAWDHWAAFALLAWTGGGMIREALSGDDGGEAGDPTRGKKLLMLAVATSIDALAVGLSLAMLRIPAWGPSLLIGAVCAIITAAGLFLGRRLAAAAIFGQRAALAGGLVLIAIGVKILFEHGVFG